MNPTQPIQNGKDRLLGQAPGTVPDVRGGILNYFRPLTLSVVLKETVNMQLVETVTPIQTSGMIQPGKQNLRMKPEGQRKWIPWTLFTLPVVVLQPDWIVRIVANDGTTTPYRVLGKRDWSQAGYVEYDLAEDYT